MSLTLAHELEKRHEMDKLPNVRIAGAINTLHWNEWLICESVITILSARFCIRGFSCDPYCILTRLRCSSSTFTRMDSMYAISATHKENVVHAVKTIRERRINMQSTECGKSSIEKRDIRLRAPIFMWARNRQTKTWNCSPVVANLYASISSRNVFCPSICLFFFRERICMNSSLLARPPLRFAPWSRWFFFFSCQTAILEFSDKSRRNCCIQVVRSFSLRHYSGFW